MAGVDVVLLHGAWFGGWCWDSMCRELADRGLRATAPDLPGGDPDAGLGDYVRAAMASIGRQGAPVVVGHSLAGILLDPLAAAVPVRQFIHLTAFVPHATMSLRDQWRQHPEMFVAGWDRGVRQGTLGTSRWVDLDAAAAVLMHDCPASTRAAAAARLRTQAWAISGVPFVARRVTRTTHVIADDDRLLSSQWLYAQALEDDLCREVRWLPGGHCPMLSRPAALADIVAEVHAHATIAHHDEG